MKNKPKLAHTLKLIASHSLVAAIVTSPYVVAVFSDLMQIATSGGVHGATTTDILLKGLSIMSGVALAIAIAAIIGYFLGKQK